jgi:chromosome segregation ATPase
MTAPTLDLAELRDTLAEAGAEIRRLLARADAAESALAASRAEVERLRADLDVAESRKAEAFQRLHAERNAARTDAKRLRLKLDRALASMSEAGPATTWPESDARHVLSEIDREFNSITRALAEKGDGKP